MLAPLLFVAPSPEGTPSFLLTFCRTPKGVLPPTRYTFVVEGVLGWEDSFESGTFETEELIVGEITQIWLALYSKSTTWERGRSIAPWVNEVIEVLRSKDEGLPHPELYG